MWPRLFPVIAKDLSCQNENDENGDPQIGAGNYKIGHEQSLSDFEVFLIGIEGNLA